MAKRRKRNYNFTTDEAQTATLMYTEGFPTCTRRDRIDGHRYNYPALRIKMCSKKGLEPASRVFGVKIQAMKQKKVVCPPELFPPDGKGVWMVHVSGKKMKKILKRLSPLIPKYYRDKWKEVWRKKKCP